METTDKFRISSHLKDIIGRDLVTNEFVAIFELVKNSFDAGATKVDIEFNRAEGTITIADNGHGMSEGEIRDKWLFVAYSEKAISQAADYRDKIKPAGQYAGNKGIGRFACDTLGESLELYSRKSRGDSISCLKIEWTEFEADSTDEFQTIGVNLSSAQAFPALVYSKSPEASGTVLLIKAARQQWSSGGVARLRRDLAKLIDPFGTTSDVVVSTWLVPLGNEGDREIDVVNGPVGNNVADLLAKKTSRIEVSFENKEITTTLFDRGRKIYSIREPSPYDELSEARVVGEVFFLNRSAKSTFTRRMGVQPVSFGSIFLFLNGFRVFPIGEETDDTLGLSRRKQQGQSRYLGTRDLMGRIDVFAPPKMFREVSSRDAGLVEDARTRALYDAVRKYLVFRLEKYVVGVNWKDKLDQSRDTPEGLETDSARSRIIDVVGALSRTKDLEILYYDDELVRVADDPEQITDGTLKAISELAEKTGDLSLLEEIESARRRVKELKESREQARDEAKRAEAETERANERIQRLKQQTAFLGSSLDIDIDRVQLLMHQAIIHTGHVRSAVGNAAYEIRKLFQLVESPEDSIGSDDWEDLLASVRQVGRRISASLAGANLSSDRLRTVLSFAQNIRVDLETDRVDGDLFQFLSEYFSVRLAGVPDTPLATFDASGLKLNRVFSPVDIAVVVDNLLDNARKAKAKKVEIKAYRKTSAKAVLRVVDDGVGLDCRRIDPTQIFERGYTGSLQGTGLGLYTVKQIIEKLDGQIELVGDGSRADFEITIPGAISES